MFVLLDEHRMQRGTEILARTDARGFDRADRVDDAARSDGQARLTQRAGEMQNVLREFS